ncbi:MAG: YqjD family protein [Hyphomonadaceae bacterium]
MAQSLESGLRSRMKANGAARGALKSRATDVLDDFGELRKDMGRLADAANQAARAELRHAGVRLETLGRDLRTRATEGAQQAGETVRSHPMAAIGVSAGAGLLIGFLLSRRH